MVLDAHGYYLYRHHLHRYNLVDDHAHRKHSAHLADDHAYRKHSAHNLADDHAYRNHSVHNFLVHKLVALLSNWPSCWGHSAGLLYICVLFYVLCVLYSFSFMDTHDNNPCYSNLTIFLALISLCMFEMGCWYIYIYIYVLMHTDEIIPIIPLITLITLWIMGRWPLRWS